MKLQSLTVIFIIIIIPIIIVTTYYLQLQSNTINLQTLYTTKLLRSTKEAIEAFEINTVEWNSKYSSTADSKRRDIMAAINTFSTSLSNNLGISGASKNYILAYVPAIAYILYDGYYIYTPAETKVMAKNSDGTTKIDEKGVIKYIDKDGNETTNIAEAATEYKHILKPFAAYSEILDGLTINYTLDNHIKIYGIIDGEFVKKSGYVINTEKIGIDDLKIDTLKENSISIEPETLSEEIVYKDNGGNYIKKSHNYIYVAENNTKVYFDEEALFQVSNAGERIDIKDISNGMYKKYVIPKKNGGKWECLEVYQDLKVPSEWYDKNQTTGKLTFIEDNSIVNGYLGESDLKECLKKDYSAINYYVEAYVFSSWIKENLGSIEVKIGDGNKAFLRFDNNNNPEDENSYFSQHKREIIKNTITNDLQQSITSYARNSKGYTYYLPELKETDWDQILNNVSIITFFQGVPIGTKYYNNYAVATSTTNKEYVSPNGLYFTNSGSDAYYHKKFCTNATQNDYTGYRNIDFIQKSYIDNNDIKQYYYPHNEYACYECLVDVSKYTPDKSTSKITQKAYSEALARERYVSK